MLAAHGLILFLMRAIALLLLLLLPTLDKAPPRTAKTPAKVKATPAPIATPAPVELDEATAAKRDQLLSDAKGKSDMAEFLEARVLYRSAIALDHDNADAKKGLASVETECLASAKRQMSEAKSYQSMNNDKEAMKSLELALKYADEPRYKEHQQIKDMIAALKRNNER